MSWKKIFINNEIKTHYKVSNKGKVKNSLTNKRLSPGKDKDGYLQVIIYDVNGKAWTRKIHRLVALAFIPNPKNYPEINHINGDKTDNSVKNLQWVTRKENMEHAWKIGLARATRLYGEKNPKNKFSEKQIHHVCELLEKDYSVKDINKHTGVSKSIIRGIKNGVIWKHISTQYNIPQVKQMDVRDLSIYHDAVDSLILAFYDKKTISTWIQKSGLDKKPV
jgi:hypothetical protein